MSCSTARCRVVAICGRKRTGKDTLAALFVERGFTHMKFASPLKAGLCAIFGFTENQIEGDAKDVVDPKWGVSPRLAMQWMGTDVMQHRIGDIMPHVGRGFWAMQLINRIRSEAPSWDWPPPC
jgi:hypothetical protein